jgi:ABC-type nitrate/sulfonate/bicarbonate transport system substrate-binding protein
MTLTDTDVTYLSWPQQGAAFANGGIDVGAVSEPFSALYTEQKLAFPFRRAADELRDPAVQVSVVLFSKTWMDRAPEQAKAFSLAYVQGMRDYYDAMKGGPKRAEVVDILASHTSLKDKALYERIQWSFMDPNGDLVMESLKDQVDWFAQRSELTDAVALDKMVDRRYHDYAQEKLGRAPTN